MKRAEAFVIGIDFGTLSARALLVNARSGECVATAVEEYRHGVIEGKKTDTALQDAEDYLAAMTKVVRKIARKAKGKIVGIGTDFTCSSPLPTKSDGTPLSSTKLRKNPHAFVKLWKHHAAQPEAERIEAVAHERGEEFIRSYNGKYSCEWLVAKLLETLRDAPEVFGAADRFIEAGDWIVWQLTGTEKRGLSAAGFKGMRVCGASGHEFPEPEFFAALHPKLRDVVASKLNADYLAPGASAGRLTPTMAKRLGLDFGIPVAVGNIDAHAAVTGCGVTQPGTLVAILGTSSCHLLLANERRDAEGVAGVVRDGVIPGLWAYEAGQAGVGDMFAWFVEKFFPKDRKAHARLESAAAKLKPGESGLLALDWWNGSRLLIDADLTGVIAGLKLSTQPHEIYRALIEASAYGTRRIIEAFASKGIRIDEVVACGGLSQKNELLLQIYADVTGRTLKVAAAEQACALGAAIHGAVAAGVYSDLHAATKAMTERASRKFVPNKNASAVYDQLYAEYLRLHDWLGRDKNSVVKRLKAIRAGALGRT